MSSWEIRWFSLLNKRHPSGYNTVKQYSAGLKDSICTTWASQRCYHGPNGTVKFIFVGIFYWDLFPEKISPTIFIFLGFFLGISRPRTHHSSLYFWGFFRRLQRVVHTVAFLGFFVLGIRSPEKSHQQSLFFGFFGGISSAQTHHSSRKNSPPKKTLQ